MVEPFTAEALVVRIAQVASGVASRAGVGAMELAGQIVSVLSAKPEEIGRFMKEGGELFIDGTFNAERGSLTFISMKGEVTSPAELRAAKTLQRMKRQLPPPPQPQGGGR